MKRNKTRLTAMALALILLFTSAATAAPPTVETDEVVYVNLDYYGVPHDTRIVKGVSLNGQDTFTDYGNYADVYNMTSHDQPELAEGSVTWNLNSDERQRFYYECIPNETETMEMPWDFDVSYKLNGVPTTAEKCAGADGLVEITLHALPNDAASEYYKNNMMLIAATGIDTSKALSIDAPGAQIQSVGTYKIVFFMGLPGEENTFTVRIGSNSFESMGLILFMAPATLSSLNLLSDMRDIKDRIGDSGDSLYQGLSDMLKTMQSMQGGLNTMSQGIAGINEVRRQLIDSRGTLDPEADEALAALDALAGQSDSLIPELNSMQTTLTSLNATVNSMLGTLSDSNPTVSGYQKLLQDLYKTLGNLDDMLEELREKKEANDWLYINDLQESISGLEKDLTTLQGDMKTMRERLDSLAGRLVALRGQIDDAPLGDELRGLLDVFLGSAEDLTDSLMGTLKTLSDATGRLSSLMGTSDSMLDTLDDMNDILTDYDGISGDLIGEGQDFTRLAESSLEMVGKLLADIPALSVSLEQLTSDANAMADKGSNMMVSLTKTLASASKLMQSSQDTLRSVRDKSDASMQTSIDGLLDVLERAAGSSSSSSLQSATDSIHNAIDEGKKDLEEDTNVLNIDAEADLQSVTSSENPSPASLQFILRTDEISVDELEDDAQNEPEAEDEGVFARIANIFKKLFSAIAGVFASEE